MERFIAIDDVCAWPNLTVLPDGTLAVAIYKQSVHGKWQGDASPSMLMVAVSSVKLWMTRINALIAGPPECL